MLNAVKALLNLTSFSNLYLKEKKYFNVLHCVTLLHWSQIDEEQKQFSIILSCQADWPGSEKLKYKLKMTRKRKPEGFQGKVLGVTILGIIKGEGFGGHFTWHY